MEIRCVETKRSGLKFYGILGLLTVLDCGMGIMMTYDLLSKGKEAVATDYFFFVLGSLFFYAAIYTVIRFFKNAPIIMVDPTIISFNEVEYLWSAVAKINLTGKQPFKYIFTYSKDGVKLTFSDGTVKYFFDDMYSNTWQIKSFIEQVIIHQREAAEIEMPEAHTDEMRFDNTETFKGKALLSLEGILFWALIVVIGMLALKNGSRQPMNSLIVAPLFGLIWFIIGSRRMHYFQLSDQYLVVRNVNFFWKQKIYALDNIREISFEAPGKLPNSLRIITKDFRNNLYPAGTLPKHRWLDLKAKLELKAIVVRNYCI